MVRGLACEEPLSVFGFWSVQAQNNVLFLHPARQSLALPDLSPCREGERPRAPLRSRSSP